MYNKGLAVFVDGVCIEGESEGEVISHCTQGMEKKKVWFWNLFTKTAGVALADHIERKTAKIIFANQDLDAIDDAAKKRTFAEARRNFGGNPHLDIFRMQTTLLNASSPLMQHFCENVANAPALDDVYNARGNFSWRGQRIWPISATPDIWSDFHLSCPLAQGVRNRYRIVMEKYMETGGGKTLSIACGSAQPLIHAVQEMVSQGDGSQAELILSDMEESSLELALQRAKDAGVGGKISRMVVAHFQKLPELFGGQKFDVIEACGICDYFSDMYVKRKILKSVFSMLRKGGMAIVSGMAETPAADLLRRIYNWEIIYRSPEVFASLVREAGGRNVKVYVEPWGIYYVAVAIK